MGNFSLFLGPLKCVCGVCVYLFQGAHRYMFIHLCISLQRPESDVMSSVTLHLVYPGRVSLLNPEHAEVADLNSHMVLGSLPVDHPPHAGIMSQLFHQPDIHMHVGDLNSSSHPCTEREALFPLRHLPRLHSYSRSCVKPSIVSIIPFPSPPSIPGCHSQSDDSYCACSFFVDHTVVSISTR